MNLIKRLNNKPLLLKVGVAVIFSWGILIALYLVLPYYQLQINLSTSLPQRFWIVHIGDKQIQAGDYIVFKFHDKRMALNNYEDVVKQVSGVAGDIVEAMPVTVATTEVINVLKVTHRKTTKPQLPEYLIYPVYQILSGYHFTPLTLTRLVIPQGCYFVHGNQQPTFDSRYQEMGFVCAKQIYGRAYPLF